MSEIEEPQEPEKPESVPITPLEPAKPICDPDGLFCLEEFRAQYPKFDCLPDDQVLAAKVVAEELTPSYIPFDPKNKIYQRKSALYLALCHVLILSTWPDQQTGRVTSAGEGSVNTSFDLIKPTSVTAQWWYQTQCGQLYWTLTAGYRRGGRMYGVSNYHPYG